MSESRTDVEALKQNLSGLYSEGFFERLFNRLGGHAQSSLVFGEPVERGDTTVIPVARVGYGFGLGGGSGRGMRSAEDPSEGGGSGGGGGILGEPVGYIEIRDGKGTRFVRTAIWGAREVGLVAVALALPILFFALSRRERNK